MTVDFSWIKHKTGCEVKQMISKEELFSIYENMNRMRMFEMKAVELFQQGLVTGSMHLYIGEEAIAATAGQLLRKDDYITSTHRGHGHCIAKGAGTDRMMAELLGRSTGYCRGKGGSMHIADFDIGILGANGIVAGGTSIAVGSGITNKIMKKNDTVTVCFFGEGASNEGVFHESLNLAAVWKLPVIFLCENNLYQVFTSVKESCSVQDISVRSVAYGIPGMTVDGNDVFELYDTLSKAVERARNGEGPTLIEAKTYRWDGHYTGDGYAKGGYRSVEEIEEWKKKDPIKSLAKYMLNNKILSENELDKIIKKLELEIARAVEFAEASPWPDESELLKDIYYGEM